MASDEAVEASSRLFAGGIVIDIMLLGHYREVVSRCPPRGCRQEDSQIVSRSSQ